MSDAEGYRTLMLQFKLKLIFIVLTALCFSTTQADSLVLNGSAVYSHLARDLYLGGLYLPTLNDDPDYIFAATTAKRMQIIVKVPSWSPRRWSQIWQNNIVINNDDYSSDPLVQEALTTFTLFPRQDLKAGDEIIIDYQPNGNSRVLLNGDLVLEVAGSTFFNYMVNTWIGKLPPTREFRQNILGQEAVDQDQKTELLSHQVQRAGLFSGWIAVEQAVLKAEQERIEQERAEQARLAAVAEQQRLQRIAEAEREAELQRQQLAEKQLQEAAKTPKAPIAPKVPVAPKVLAAPAAVALVPQATKNTAQTASVNKKPQAGLVAPKTPDSTQTAVNSKKLEAEYIQAQLKRTADNVRYPARARLAKQQGKEVVEFDISKDGKVIALRDKESSGHRELNKAIYSAIKASEPYPPLPTDLNKDQLTLTLDYDFTL